MQRIKLEEL